jgi:hypothetical protein
MTGAPNFANQTKSLTLLANQIKSKLRFGLFGLLRTLGWEPGPAGHIPFPTTCWPETLCIPHFGYTLHHFEEAYVGMIILCMHEERELFRRLRALVEGAKLD